MRKEVTEYLEDVRFHLHLDHASEQKVMEELYTYFQEKTAELEDKGVDMHLLEEAFHSAHHERSELFDTVKSSYTGSYSGGAEVLRKVKEIERRGRYTRKE